MIEAVLMLWLAQHVTYSDALPSKFKPCVDNCFAQWSIATGIVFERVSSGGEIVISMLPSTGTQLAATSISFQNNRITHANIELNGTFWRWHVGKPYGVRLKFRGKSRAELSCVLLHEIGHALGMPHSVNQGDVMYPVVFGFTRLSDGDIASARALYGVQ